MFGLDEAKKHHDDMYEGGEQHEAKLSHEVLSGGAAFEAMKMFEDHQRKKGNPVKHQFAKELLMGIAGGEVDKLVEGKGMDYIDKEKAKRDAQQRAADLYDGQYGDMNEYDP